MEDSEYPIIIPAQIVMDSALPPGAKLLFGLMSQLQGEQGYCYATSAYLGKRLGGAGRRTVLDWIAALKNRGFIDVVIERKAAKEKDAQRKIYILSDGVRKSAHPVCGNPRTGVRKTAHPVCENPHTPVCGNPRIEEESINNINKNTSQGELFCDSCFAFAEFWDSYGLKTDRAKCEAKYKKLSEADRAKIREALPRYVKATFTNGAYPSRKNPLTWLNGRNWEDEALAEDRAAAETERKCAL